ncbi:hypothetical protein [Streptomyces antimycoticus]|uniref:hypothetical protein n=1 Tax=Streptomyces antimycoticus TaxID=68175 RepID=UPI0036E0EAA5
MFGSKRLSEKLDQLPDVITEAIKSGLGAISDKLDRTHSAAQDASSTAASTGKTVDSMHFEMQRLSTEVASLRVAIENLRAGPAEAHTPAVPDDGAEDDFEALLALAAGIAYAEITCHRDTWDFLVTQSSGGQHFRLPGFVEETDCLINADVSGRTLIAVVDALWRTRRDPATDPGTRHLASKIYGRIGDALGKIPANEPATTRPTRASRDNPPVIHIVIDDRPPAEASG